MRAQLFLSDRVRLEPLDLLIEEVTGARGIAPSRVLGVDAIQRLRATPAVSGSEVDDRLDLRERDLQLTQSSDQPCAVELSLGVVPIPGVVVDTRLAEKTELVVDSEVPWPRAENVSRTLRCSPDPPAYCLATGLPHKCAASPRIKVKPCRSAYAVDRSDSPDPPDRNEPEACPDPLGRRSDVPPNTAAGAHFPQPAPVQARPAASGPVVPEQRRGHSGSRHRPLLFDLRSKQPPRADGRPPYLDPTACRNPAGSRTNACADSAHRRSGRSSGLRPALGFCGVPGAAGGFRHQVPRIRANASLGSIAAGDRAADDVLCLARGDKEGRSYLRNKRPLAARTRGRGSRRTKRRCSYTPPTESGLPGPTVRAF